MKTFFSILWVFLGITLLLSITFSIMSAIMVWTFQFPTPIGVSIWLSPLLIVVAGGLALSEKFLDGK